jgi:formylglycine-generating enzyme required for sulfatase activity
MIVIPAGSFEMGDVHAIGDGEEKPVHTVHIQKPFALSNCQLKFDEYDYYAEVTDRFSKEDEGWGRGTRPVINVSWEDAVEYAKWLSMQTGKRYRLPTEAEWEYAARSGGEDKIWAGISDEKQLVDYAVFGIKQTRPVASKKPNGFGLFDMSGNVWEWIEDCWHENYTGAPTDGSAWLEANRGNCGKRVVRGGSWDDKLAFSLRAANRRGEYADYGFSHIGFRLARDIE